MFGVLHRKCAVHAISHPRRFARPHHVALSWRAVAEACRVGSNGPQRCVTHSASLRGVTRGPAYRTTPWIHLNMATGSRRTDVRKDTASPPRLPPNHAPTPVKVERLATHGPTCHDPNDVMARQAYHRRSHDLRFARAGQREAVAHRDSSFPDLCEPRRVGTRRKPDRLMTSNRRSRGGPRTEYDAKAMDARNGRPWE